MKSAQTMRLIALAVCAASLALGSAHAQTTTQGAKPATPAPPTTAVIDPPLVPTPAVPPAAPKDDLTMPKWSEFPVPPKDVPTQATIKTRVDSEETLRDKLTAEVNALHWDGDVAETYQAATKARIDPEMLKPIDAPMSSDAIEAFAAQARKRAVPPPIVN